MKQQPPASVYGVRACEMQSDVTSLRLHALSTLVHLYASINTPKMENVGIIGIVLEEMDKEMETKRERDTEREMEMETELARERGT
jgi:hypothetical protein